MFLGTRSFANEMTNMHPGFSFVLDRILDQGFAIVGNHRTGWPSNRYDLANLATFLWEYGGALDRPRLLCLGQRTWMEDWAEGTSLVRTMARVLYGINFEADDFVVEGFNDWPAQVEDDDPWDT